MSFTEYLEFTLTYLRRPEEKLENCIAEIDWIKLNFKMAGIMKETVLFDLDNGEEIENNIEEGMEDSETISSLNTTIESAFEQEKA